MNNKKFKYWFPVFLWMSFIFWMSTGTFSSEHTSTIIVPIIKFIVSEISDEKANFIHGLIRKSGHVTEYFILGGLVIRAFCAGTISILTRKQIFCSLLVVALYVRIPVESGHHSGGKKATIPMGKRPAFRFDCGHHSGEKGQCAMRE